MVHVINHSLFLLSQFQQWTSIQVQAKRHKAKLFGWSQRAQRGSKQGVVYPQSLAPQPHSKTL